MPSCTRCAAATLPRWLGLGPLPPGAPSGPAAAGHFPPPGALGKVSVPARRLGAAGGGRAGQRGAGLDSTVASAAASAVEETGRQCKVDVLWRSVLWRGLLLAFGMHLWQVSGLAGASRAEHSPLFLSRPCDGPAASLSPPKWSHSSLPPLQAIEVCRGPCPAL